MKIIFTLCSNNYLGQALVLYRSVLKHEPTATFILGLTDAKHPDIDYTTWGCQVIEAAAIEKDVDSLARRYNIIELNTCLKPTYFQYCFDHLQATEVVYLDPDICMYQPLEAVWQQLEHHDIVITPHIYTPLPLDGHTPQENLFLNYGLYNLGFLASKRTDQSLSFIRWWKDRTYQFGYDKPAIGLFTDQLWINLVPLYFDKVAILQDSGYNMAPWNLHERTLDDTQGYYRVNHQYKLAFFHFSSFNPGDRKLHREYTRYQWEQRPDLHSLYKSYQTNLHKEGYDRYKTFTCHYVTLRKEYLKEQEALQQQQTAAAFARLPYGRRFGKKVKQLIPRRIKRFTLKLITS